MAKKRQYKPERGEREFRFEAFLKQWNAKHGPALVGFEQEEAIRTLQAFWNEAWRASIRSRFSKGGSNLDPSEVVFDA